MPPYFINCMIMIPRSVWLVSILLSLATIARSEWGYECQKGNCQKVRVSDKDIETAVSLGECRFRCTPYAGIWPKPTGPVKFGSSLVQLNINSIDVLLNGGESPAKELTNAAAKRFKNIIETKSMGDSIKTGGKSLEVTFQLNDLKTSKMLYNGDETYELNVEMTSDGRISALIKANNFFGARHGLETLSQIIVFDDIRDQLLIPIQFSVQDSPVYPHRGILLDTSRNFISKAAIKRTIEGMAASKLNIFHWHITDSQSFPYVSQSVPELSKLGAYSKKKVYNRNDVAEIIEFGRVRGVKVMPEFDAPAHVGEGWQDTGHLACFDKKPWQSYCVEPPCGQLDPTQDEMYDILELIYKDMVEQFDPDVFHMGGDEVNENCWKSEKRIVDWMKAHNYSIDQDGFMKLWNKFQTEALQRFNKQRGHDVPIILWTSTLTEKEYLTKYLPNSTYIIQIWTTGEDKQITNLLENGYRTILSNYDALYLDCGFAGWVTDGNNWCAPYIGWQKVYENSPEKIAGKYKHLMMGAEATLWTEQADDFAVDSRLWPRAAAMAERLWAEPKSTWHEAEDRFMIHRERLVQLKINPDTLQPEWCARHQGSCPNDGPLNKE